MNARILAALLIAASSSPLFAQQERPVPNDSARLSIFGCARGRVFTVRRNPDGEIRGTELQEGRKLRLEGAKKVLEEIKTHEGSMVEISGLIKRSDISPAGINILGGRVRIAPGATPGSQAGRNPGPSVAVIDVESWRLLNAACPS